MKKNKSILYILAVIVGLILVNIISSKAYERFDLTKDKRYTLSEVSKSMISDLDSPLIIDVFLEGDFPSEFRLLQTEVRQIIEEFQLETNQIFINYINPIEDESTRQQYIEELTRQGLEPYINTDNSTGKVTQDIIFPWAYATYKDERVKIPLLKRSITQGLQEQITNSVQSLEYAFADGFNKLVNPKAKKIAILKGNGELGDLYIADFLQTIKPYYNLAQFTLDSVASNPQGTLDKLKQYDLIVAAKPSEAFTENEKLVLDQYTMSGGKSLWLTESVVMDQDSLKNVRGTAVSIMRDLKLNDFFFKYGFRVNPTLVKDLFSAPIMLAIGEGTQAQMQPLQWQYSPLAASNPKHSITKNLNLVKFDFASPIDTLKNGIKKTILLQSSPKSKLEGALTTISLADVTKAPDEATYNSGPQNLAVLLEGEFTSVYDKRVLPFKVNNFQSQSKPTKMVVISDGDIIKNEVIRNRPQELGFDQLTGKAFGNKEFLLNTVNYLLDDTGLINIRAKEINIAFLDADKIKDNKGKWQLINIVLPLVILALFGFVFNYFRKKKYA
ncbi:gliding motility-associated ABC transporter substrate-binding protein GldG [Winogradskyella echinorum]|uniref:Gliding motility-associated ABC transporter substrate-binding protein GldG n=1 Tax=Winogradskyella echinorum TaxID=538189 RepID=A0ABR6Y697_9FLAO|nr:gliding motility-associated ABC transporter substrate-binding protein GldG [Winogradskyella echinorum]MBC3847773.1 gliding motility-associated ABC transporter substrate-binding protein GldG [Winogradskyella echinorum]MBC5752121.1 gliding motility-associated ABC transporter substrate-binding protein GldG [Winogradskyella echinorum]